MTSLDHYLFLNSIIHFIVEREGVGWLDGWMVGWLDGYTYTISTKTINY